MLWALLAARFIPLSTSSIDLQIKDRLLVQNLPPEVEIINLLYKICLNTLRHLQAISVTTGLALPAMGLPT